MGNMRLLLKTVLSRTRVALWTAASAPGDGQTSLAYSSQPVQYLYINRLLSINKPVLSYLLLHLLPHLLQKDILLVSLERL
jgi:hypothetical protein